MATGVGNGPIPAGGQRMTDAEALIRKSMAMKHLPQDRLWEEAMNEWGRDLEHYTKRIDRREGRLETVRNEVYQLVGFFSAFQGLLLTAVSQQGPLHCKNRGFPLALSAFATAVTVVGVCQKHGLITKLQYIIATEDPVRKVLVRRLDCLRLRGMDFDFNQYIRDNEPANFRPAPKKGNFKAAVKFFFSYKTGVVGCLLIFGALCLATMHQILCNSD